MNTKRTRLFLISLRCLALVFFYACVKAIASEYECTSALDLGNDTFWPGAVGGGMAAGGCYGGPPTGPPGPLSSTVPGNIGNPPGPTTPQSGGGSGTRGSNTGRNDDTTVEGQNPEVSGDTPDTSDAMGTTDEGSNVDRNADTGVPGPVDTSDGLSLDELFNHQSGSSPSGGGSGGGSSGGSSGGSGGQSLGDLLRGAGIPTDGNPGNTPADGIVDALDQLNQ